MLHHLYSSFHNPYAEGYEFLGFILIAVFAFLWHKLYIQILLCPYECIAPNNINSINERWEANLIYPHQGCILYSLLGFHLPVSYTRKSCKAVAQMWFNCRILFALDSCLATIEFRGKADRWAYCKPSKGFSKVLGLVVENIYLNTLLKCVMKKLT